MHPEMWYKFCKSAENRGRDTPMWGVYSYIPNFRWNVSCGAKNLNIALWVTYIPALCAAGNAAGNQWRRSDPRSSQWRQSWGNKRDFGGMNL